MMELETYISTFIENQFPSFYKDEGPQFIAFVKAYYAWMEQEGEVLNHTRKLKSYRDIDTTLDDFIVHFKEQYLKNIQFDTATNKQLLVKNSMDLYRSKGSPQSIDLFFKLIYGTEAKVFYPADKILRSSDGIWVKPSYLEITETKYNVNYVGKQIVGSISGAKAFVEKFIKRKSNDKYVNILYISNQSGDFVPNELVGYTEAGSDIFNTEQNAYIKGSISTVDLISKGSDFKVGDLVNFSSNVGSGGIGRVANTSNTTGVINFSYLDGGFGYTVNADCLVSEKVVSTTYLSNASSDSFPEILEEVVEPLVGVTFTGASNTFTVGTSLSLYANGSLKSTANILSITQTGANGTAVLSTSGPLTSNVQLHTASNVEVFTVDTVTDRTITSTLLGYSNNFAYNSNGSYSVGLYGIKKNIRTLNYTSANNDDVLYSSKVYQYSSNGSTSAVGDVITSSFSANAGSLTILPISGYFTDGLAYTTSNAAKLTVVDYTSTISGGDLIQSDYAYLRTLTSNVLFAPTSLSFGTDADFNVGSLGDQETIFINTDLVSANLSPVLDLNRKIVTVASNSGFSAGDTVTQLTQSSTFNALGNLTPATGFIAIASANTKYNVGDFIQYVTSAGNTTPEGLTSNSYYYVKTSNSTGVTLASALDLNTTLSNSSYSSFGNNLVSESGHTLLKLGAGTIYSIVGANLYIKDLHSDLGATGSTNGNLILYSNSAVNTSISAITSAPSVNTSSLPMIYSLLRKDGFGLPKSPTAGIRDTIYSTLTFNTFNIGSIATLSGVNPGQDYNADPYVLVYQPYIAAFDRNDLNLEISGASKSFTVGEQVQQTLPSLRKFTLQVDGGVYGNTYSELTYNTDIQYGVSNTADFIYSQGTPISFNANTAVSSNDDFITLASHSLEVGSYVRYYTDAGNTALTNLSNNNFYFVNFANTSGVKLSTTSGGSTINLTSGVTESGHYILNHYNTLANGLRVLYYTTSGGAVITGLSNNSPYYVVSSNSSGFKLSSTLGGSAIDLTSNSTSSQISYFKTIPGWLPGELIYENVARTFDANTAVSNTTEAITLSTQPYSDGDSVLYYTSTGNTVISGLANNTTYYVVGSNSTTIKLSNTVGGSALNLTSGLSESGHNLLSVANGTIEFVYTTGANSYVVSRVANNTFSGSANLYSYTNAYNNFNIANVSLSITTSTAKGLVKEGSNTSLLKIKRLSFENTFQDGGVVIGTTSSASANITSVYEDETTLPIGLNAQIEADSVVANGQVISMEVIDSGYGFTNGSIIDFTSADGTHGGEIKLTLGGVGKTQGYYKSTRGFLSSDMVLQDGDYYQEYSYEIISRLSLDKYAEMYKKVMHLAGTKFFGSVEVSSIANTNLGLAETSITQLNV